MFAARESSRQDRVVLVTISPSGASLSWFKEFS